MIMKSAGEIMLPLELFPYIPYWFTLHQALAELEEFESAPNRPKSLPWIILLFNAQSEFLGLVQRQDILRGLRPNAADILRGSYPSFSNSTADPNLSRLSFSPERALQELKTQIDHQMVEFMTPFKITVDFDDPALLAIYIMIDYDLAFVPVVKAGQIVGILYVEDALKEVISAVK